MIVTQASRIVPSPGERLAAGMVLAGTTAPSVGSCLSAEKLAALVDQRLAAGERQAALIHLAGCERCYAVWREVTCAAGHRGSRRGVLVRLLHPRSLSYIGSALAVAASVMVFVQLHQSGLPEAGLQAPPSRPAPVLPLEQENSMELPLQGLAPDFQDKALPAVPPAFAPSPPAEQIPAQPAKPLPRQAAEPPRPERKARPAAPPLPAQRPPADGTAPQALPPVPGSQAAPSSLSVPPAEQGAVVARQKLPLPATLAWQQQLVGDCRQPVDDIQHWVRLHQRGLQLLEQQGPGESRQRHEALLSALANMHSSADITEQCAVIRRLAAAPESLP